MELDLSKVTPLSFSISQQNLGRIESLKAAHSTSRSRILNAVINLGLEQLEQSGNKKPALN